MVEARTTRALKNHALEIMGDDMKYLTILLSCAIVGCSTVPAGYGQPKIYDNEGRQIGYITQEPGGVYNVRNRDGITERTIRP